MTRPALAAVDPDMANRWQVKAHLDDNTCLAPDVQVTTRAGMVYAEDVTLDDELLTHSGRWIRPSRIVVSHVEEQLVRVRLADRSMRLTWDHPVLVQLGDQYVWRNAGDLAAGDLVVDQSSLEFGTEPSVVDLDLGEAPDGVATAGEVRSLPAVDVGSQGVPVRTVCLDDQPRADQEVNDPRADLGLGSVVVAQPFEVLADAAFDAGLRAAGEVAALGAVPSASGLRRGEPHGDGAVLAGADNWRASAGFGAVASRDGLSMAERRAAADTDRVASSAGVAAYAGAVGVPAGAAGGDVEGGLASGTSLRDPVSPSSALPGLVPGVGVHALARAVDLAPARDLSGALPTPGRRRLRVCSGPSGFDGAASALRSVSYGDPAAQTHPVHLLSVQVATVAVVSVDREEYAGEVYDFTVPEDHTFWAGRILVHNCDPCRNNSTKVYKNRADAHKDYPGGRGFKDCVGAQYGNKCRCTVVKRRKGGTNAMTPEQLANLNQRIRTQSETMSARAFAPPLPDGAVAPTEKLTMRAAEAADDGSGNTQIYLYDYIGGWDGVKAADVALMLAGLTGPVDLHINSGGGSIFEGVAIYNQLVAYDRAKGPVVTYIDSLAASAASFIALAGREVVCEATATLMTHDGQGGAIGTADMLREVADLLDMLSNTIAGIYAKKTGTPADEWRETMRDGDTWYTAAAALEAGLVDRVANGDEPDPEEGDASNVLDLGIFNTWAAQAEAPADVAPAVADAMVALAAAAVTEPPAPEAPAFTLSAEFLEGIRSQMKEVFA